MVVYSTFVFDNVPIVQRFPSRNSKRSYSTKRKSDLDLFHNSVNRQLEEKTAIAIDTILNQKQLLKKLVNFRMMGALFYQTCHRPARTEREN